MKKYFSVFFAAMMALSCFTACGSDSAATKEKTNSDSKSLQIVTTIFPEYDWVKNILGEESSHADITMLLDNGVDLHSYQPTADDILKVSTCDLFLYVGGESDAWVEDALKNATNKEMQVINLMDVMGDAAKEEEVVEGMQPEEEDSEEPELDELAVEEQLAQLEDSLSDSEKAAVLITVDDEREYLYKDKYFQESVYMQLDPLDIVQTELVYRIQAEDEGLAQRLGTLYKNIVGGVGLYDWVEQQTGIDAAYAAELISVSTNPEIFVRNGVNISTGSDNLKVTVIQKDEETCGQLAAAVSSYMEQQQKNLVKELGNHELILLSETSGKIISTDVMSRQIDYGNQVSNLRSGIASSKAGFTADQAKYYDLLTWEEGMDEAEIVQKDTVEEQAVAVSPSVSKKYILLGAVLFAFVYAGILFLVYIFNSKLRVSDELQNLYHIPQIGVVVKDSKKKFILDKWVDDLRHYGKRKFDAEQSMELAFAAVKIAAMKSKLSNVCLMGCNLSAGAGKVCESLKAALEKEGIQVTVLDNVLYNAESMEKVEAMTGVVLVEKAGSTLYNEVANELALLKRQDIAVLGGIIVE